MSIWLRIEYWKLWIILEFVKSRALEWIILFLVKENNVFTKNNIYLRPYCEIYKNKKLLLVRNQAN